MMDRERDRDLLRTRLLGRGLRCEPPDPGVNLWRDLILDATTGDLAQVEGVDNLSQALAIALTTPLGGDVFNIDFGFDGLNAMTVESSPILVQERIRIAVISVLQKD